MHMVVHQAEKIQPHGIGSQAVFQPFQETFAVMIINKDVRTAVAANCDMIDRPLKLHSQLSWHTVNLSKSTKLGKH